MKVAHEAGFAEIDRQGDTFHAVAHRLGAWRNHLESSAYSAIEWEYDRLRILENAKSQYNQAQIDCVAAIRLYEDFEFLYHCLLENFQVFDNNGLLKDAKRVVADFDTALDCILTLNHPKINKEIACIQNCKSELFLFLKIAQITVCQLRDNGTTYS